MAGTEEARVQIRLKTILGSDFEGPKIENRNTPVDSRISSFHFRVSIFQFPVSALRGFQPSTVFGYTVMSAHETYVSLATYE
jgi:hypothetical protein